MTLVAVWYRKERRDIYAIADSRLTGATGILTDQAPKFTTVRVVCYGEDKRGHFNNKVLDREIAIGYAGSSSVAFATITNLQAYTANLTLKTGSTPTLEQICELAQRLLDSNFRDFGKLWTNVARCDLLIFGCLPTDNSLKCFHLGSNIAGDSIVTECAELPLEKDGLCCAFGSCGSYFMEKLKADMEATGYFHPFNMLTDILKSGERSDVGGFVQVAIANKEGVTLPHVLRPQPELGDHQASVTFLGRDVSDIGSIGNCSVGRRAVGPDLKR